MTVKAKFRLVKFGAFLILATLYYAGCIGVGWIIDHLSVNGCLRVLGDLWIYRMLLHAWESLKVDLKTDPSDAGLEAAKQEQDGKQ